MSTNSYHCYPSLQASSDADGMTPDDRNAPLKGEEEVVLVENLPLESNVTTQIPGDPKFGPCP